MASHTCRKALLLCMLLLANVFARGQDNPTFAIRGYQIEGNRLLPQACHLLPYRVFNFNICRP